MARIPTWQCFSYRFPGAGLPSYFSASAVALPPGPIASECNRPLNSNSKLKRPKLARLPVFSFTKYCEAKCHHSPAQAPIELVNLRMVRKGRRIMTAWSEKKNRRIMTACLTMTARLIGKQQPHRRPCYNIA